MGYPVSATYTSAGAITPSDSAAISPPWDGLFVGSGGTTLTVVTVDGQTVAFTNVPNGTFLPVKVTAVMATGTDATDIVGLR